MREHVTILAANPTLSVSQIYERLLTAFRQDSKNEPFSIPSKETVRRLVSMHRGEVSPSVFSMFGTSQARTSDGHSFLQAFRKSNVKDKTEEIAVWASAEGLSILRQNGQCFIDATFRITPRPYVQCAIVMAFDASTDIYVPTAWALMTSRSESMYRLLLHELQSLMDHRWQPDVCVADFEQALLSAINALLPRTRIIGCYFHFKQSIVRKLARFGTTKADAASIASRFDFLTVIPVHDIPRALEYIAGKIRDNFDATDRFMT